MKTFNSATRPGTLAIGLFLAMSRLAAADTIILGQTITNDTTWGSGTYHVEGNVIVDGATLTIAQGVTVKFDYNTSLQIGGMQPATLHAVGTPGSEIEFTEYSSSGWNGIVLTANAGSSQISYAQVLWAGIAITGGSPTISNSLISSSGYGVNISGGSPTIIATTLSLNDYGVYTSYPATPSLQNLTLVGNGRYGGFAISQDAGQTLGTVTGLIFTNNNNYNWIELRGGTVGVNTTWQNIGTPYYVSLGYPRSLTVSGSGPSPPVLTIQAGVTVEFDTSFHDTVLQIGDPQSGNQGALQAAGTAAAPVVLTSAAPNPAPGDWQGIYFTAKTASASTTMSYATVSYAGHANSQHGSIHVEGGVTPTISNVTLANNKYAGLTVNNGSPTIVSSTFAGNDAGIINATPSVSVNALLNYWGNSSGPALCPGTGQCVSQGVQFDPWLVSPPSTPEYFKSGMDSNLEFVPPGPAQWTLTAFEQDQNTSWTLVISDSLSNPIRTLTGNGQTFNTTWDGTDDNRNGVPAGNYPYAVQAMDSQRNTARANGMLIVDRNPLGVSITYPTGGSVVSNVYTGGMTDVTIMGTIDINNFDSNRGWIMEYGAGNNWTQIAMGHTQNPPNLGIWATLSIPNGPDTLRLTAWDTAGNQYQTTNLVTLANFTVSQQHGVLQLDSFHGGHVTYTSIVPSLPGFQTLTETLWFQDANCQSNCPHVSNLIPQQQQQRPPGTYTDTWYGKNDSGGYLKDGPYLYFAQVTAGQGQYTMTWDLTRQYYNNCSWYATQFSFPQSWDPFNNQPLTATYTSPCTSRMNIALMQSDLQGCDNPHSYCVEQSQYAESGQHTIAWAGVDSTWTLRSDLTYLAVNGDQAMFSENAVVLFGTKPSIDSVTVHPVLYQPASGMQEVDFQLTTTTQNASVTVTFLNQESKSVLKTRPLGNLTGGGFSTHWDGHADNGYLVAPGVYVVTVTAQDTLGNQAQGQILMQVKY